METSLFIIFRRINDPWRYMTTSFYTISGSAAGAYKEKGSKFISLAFPVASEDEVKNRLAEVKKKYFDAQHHCYAYVLGADKNKVRANDDGEPNHSAGDPILGQIKSRNLTNVLVVVVRYFGGTKLGVGGLVTAYKTAAEEALKNASIIEQQILYRVKLVFPYETTLHIMKLVKDFELKIIRQQFEESCSMEVDMLLAVKGNFLEHTRLMNATGTEFKIVKVSEN